ncbi:MAG: hypothetical protein AB7N80_03445 [Bdellovibrionales bacterium]
MDIFGTMIGVLGMALAIWQYMEVKKSDKARETQIETEIRN